MKKIFLLCALACASLPAAASTLEAIDAAVEELGSFLLRTVPDRRGVTVGLEPLLSDEHGQSLLGDRLKSELELFLTGGFKSTRLVDPPEGSYRIAGEIQAYAGRLRIIVKVFRSDGTLVGGTRTEMALTAEIEELLRPPPRLERFDLIGPESVEEDDGFEPDDAPGFEVEVTEKGSSSFDRFLSPGDVDRFRFYLEAPAVVVLETVTEVDTQLLLYREGENIPFMVNDNRGESRSSRLEASLEAGYFIAEVFAYDFNIRGPYTLMINLSGTVNDGYEPDDTLAGSRPLNAGSRQERALLAGDRDYVELVFQAPGFYTLYTSGVQVDTRLTLTDELENVIVEDGDSGELFNAQVGLFLGTQRVFARIEAEESAASGNYTLVFAGFDPPQIYPNGTVQLLKPSAGPRYLKLRILQGGSFLVRWKSAAAQQVGVTLFSLPGMRSMSSRESEGGRLFTLRAGDYLLAVASEEPETIRLCVAEENAADNCSRMLAE